MARSGGPRQTQFHGARREIADTHVRPPSMTGAYPASSVGFGEDHVNRAFATNSEHEAWHYARMSDAPKTHPAVNDPDPKHRARVYEVAPAADQFRDHPGGEIMSRTGFPILRAHDVEVGATGTFPQVNWNAYKAKPAGSHFVPGGDANHSYMEVDHDRPAHVPPPHQEAGPPSRYRAEDQRHPDQLNLFTGHTVAEHKEYENTPGMLLHPDQFPNMRHDPTSTTIRASKPYHAVDTQFGTVR